jgi:hypothetical protein
MKSLLLLSSNKGYRHRRVSTFLCAHLVTHVAGFTAETSKTEHGGDEIETLYLLIGLSPIEMEQCTVIALANLSGLGSRLLELFAKQSVVSFVVNSRMISATKCIILYKCYHL